jgi:hypothetical protein
MRYAAVCKSDSEPLGDFIKRKAASTNAQPGSRGDLGDVRQPGPRDDRREGDQALDVR